jgi:hypothetical protein
MNSYRPPASQPAAAVAAWLRAAWPDVWVDDGEVIVLRSDRRTEAELRLIWKACAWNEAAAASRAPERRAVMDLLLS